MTGENISLQRRSLVSTTSEAIDDIVQDGMTIALGGFHTASRAMALVRAIVRAGRRDLTLIGSPAALDADLLIATGCVKRVILPYVGVEGMVATAPFFRHAAEAGTLEIREVDEGMVLAMFKAARQGMDFLPWKGGVGTSIPELNGDLKVIDDPLSGKPVIAVPAVRADVALLHAAQADCFGNVQHLGNAFGDALMASAANACIVQVERLVPVAVTRRHPDCTTIPAPMVSAVVHAPYGGHPFYSQRNYVMDRSHVRAYLKAAEAKLKDGFDSPWNDYLQRFVFGPEDHLGYLEAVGLRQLLALNEIPESEADDGLPTTPPPHPQPLPPGEGAPHPQPLPPGEGASRRTVFKKLPPLLGEGVGGEEDFSQAELQAVFIARQIKDGEQVIAGTNLEVPRAALLLAHWHHAPNLRVQLGGYMVNLFDAEKVERFSARADFDRLGVPGIESYVPLDFENLWRVDLTFIGGLQVDRYGNTNMIGIRGADGRFKMRGPGTVGTATLTTFIRRYFIFVNQHTPRLFVPRCDYVSSVGWGQGGKDAREKLGLPGDGPEFIITPECIMDFDPEAKSARLRYLMPGATIDDVQAKTGFPLPVAPELCELPLPTPEEVAILRSRVDPAGVLRQAQKGE